MPFLSCLGILLAVIHALQSIPITCPYSIVHSSQSAAQTPLEFLNLTGHPPSENYFHSNTKILFSLLLFQEFTMIFFFSRGHKVKYCKIWNAEAYILLCLPLKPDSNIVEK